MKKYKNKVLGIILSGVIIWIIFGTLSQKGIFTYGINFGFNLSVRRLFAFLDLTSLIVSIFLSLIATYAYRRHFPNIDRNILKIINGYNKLSVSRRIVFWIIFLLVIVNIMLPIIALYIFVFTDNFVFNLEFLNTISAILLILVLILVYIPFKKESDQEKEKEQIETHKYTQKWIFKLMSYALLYISATFILSNFLEMFFTTDSNKTFYYLALQLIYIPLYSIFLRWVFKFRKKYFSVEPDKRKKKYFLKMVIIEITGFLLAINYVLLYSQITEPIIENYFGSYSHLRFLFDVSLLLGFLLFCFGTFMTVVISMRAD